MKLNLYTIKDEIKQWTFHGTPVGDKWQGIFDGFVYCQQLPVQWDQHTLYVLPASALDLSGIIPKWVQLLLLGKPSAAWINGGFSMLYICSEVTPEMVLSSLSACFQRYNQWMDAMQEIIDQQLPVSQFAEQTAKLVNHEIYGQARGYYVLFDRLPQGFYSAHNFQSYLENHYIPPQSYMPIDILTERIANHEYVANSMKRTPFIMRMLDYPCDSLYYNIFYKETCVALVVFNALLEPFRDRDYLVISTLGSFLNKSLILQQAQNMNRPAEQERVLSALLQRQLIPDEEIEHMIQQQHWKMQDSYMCSVLRLISKEDITLALNPLAVYIASLLKDGAYYSIYNGSIVFIYNLSWIQKSRRQLITLLIPILRDNLLTGSFSPIYNSFNKLYWNYQLCLIAEKCGKRKNPDYWYYLFEDYLVDYYLECATRNMTPDSLICPGLLALVEHDASKGTRYVELLRIYLENERSAVAASRAAYLSRSTFLYQLERIKRILNMDLDNSEVRLALQLSLCLLKART